MNYKIVIDAGHGGTDPGASGNGIVEKDMNLQISKYMYDRFNELGIPVKMTRTTDETLSPTERVNRVKNAFGNYSNVIVLSNHNNAGGGEGAEVIYALRNNSTLSDSVLAEIGKEGQIIRKAYQRRLPSDSSKDYYFMQRETGVTQPITIEYAFADNAADATKLKNNWQRYAEAAVRGVLNYIGYEGNTGTGNTYTVRSGDSLWSIANKYGITVDALKSANGLTNNLLSVGQVLTIPGGVNQPETGDYQVYTVVSGDTLYSIANRYNTTVDQLISYNNLSTTSLTVGQQILIPNTTSSATTYTVQMGDTLYSIASRYNTTVQELMTLNNLTNNILNAGQQLLIPSGTSNNQVEYIVKAGDNLYGIASRYGTTVDAIKNLNNLTSNLLSIGQTLLIPSNSSGSTTYTVKAGDALYSIASRYNTTVDDIKRKNNLTSNTLSIGQILVI